MKIQCVFVCVYWYFVWRGGGLYAGFVTMSLVNNNHIGPRKGTLDEQPNARHSVTD